LPPSTAAETTKPCTLGKTASLTAWTLYNRQQADLLWHVLCYVMARAYSLEQHNCCGFTISHLRFSEHITKIIPKAHQRANLIHRCFTCNCDMLVKAFKVYVRPILEYNSPVWSPSFVKDILLIASVQRKFTKEFLACQV